MCCSFVSRRFISFGVLFLPFFCRRGGCIESSFFFCGGAIKSSAGMYHIIERIFLLARGGRVSNTGCGVSVCEEIGDWGFRGGLVE